MLERELVKLGLSEKASKVYLAVLELGPSTVQNIARRAGIKRATTYVMIKFLIEKGLMSSFEKGQKKYFVAESPERLLSLVRLQEKELKDKEREFSAILPELKGLLGGAEEKPRVRFYEGKEGIKAIQEEITRAKEAIEEFIPLDDAYCVFPPEAKDHRQRVAEKLKNVPIHTIYSTKQGPILPEKAGLHEKHFLPMEECTFSGEVVIFGNKAAIISYKGKLMGVVIESKEVVATLRCLFHLAWKYTQRYTKKQE